MAKSKLTRWPGGVWSATPTPFTEDMQVDTDAVARLVDHHVRLGVKGLFLAGTCGEGPWMPDRSRRALVAAVAACAKGKLAIAVQVTDNSAARIIDNMQNAYNDGADLAVIAPPFFLLNTVPANITELYQEAIRACPLPVGIYDRGNLGAVTVPEVSLKKIYAEPNVSLIKDSSMSPARREIALAARKKRPVLTLLNGWEFNCIDYLTAGYDGLLLGGGIFNGYIAAQIIDAVKAGDLRKAEKLQQRMNRLMYDVYGGKKIACWLSGLKKLLCEMCIFSTWKNYLNYPLTASCEKAIQRVLQQDADILLPR